jgi:HEAT repeat protein
VEEYEMIDTNIQFLIGQLEAYNQQTRQQARLELIRAGENAIPLLAKAVSGSNPNLRWQAAKTLSQITIPAVIPVLIDILKENEYFGVRWLAADGLIKAGKTGLFLLLRSLTEHFDSVWLREGAHHVLRSLHDRGVECETIEKTLRALEGIEPAIEVPWAAAEALQQLEKDKLMQFSE